MFCPKRESTLPGGGTVFAAATSCRRPVVLFSSSVAAGYPSPAEDYVEGKLDLNAQLIRRPAATFIIRVEGESMTGAGIFPNDLLIVDRGVGPRPGDIVIAVVGNELTVKRLIKSGDGWSLRAENPDFPAISVTADMECVVWGVVTGSIRQFNRR